MIWFGDGARMRKTEELRIILKYKISEFCWPKKPEQYRRDWKKSFPHHQAKWAVKPAGRCMPGCQKSVR